MATANVFGISTGDYEDKQDVDLRIYLNVAKSDAMFNEFNARFQAIQGKQRKYVYARGKQQDKDYRSCAKDDKDAQMVLLKSYRDDIAKSLKEYEQSALALFEEYGFKIENFDTSEYCSFYMYEVEVFE
jgi:hypothetical protein